jgi:hypothetical protein
MYVYKFVRLHLRFFSGKPERDYRHVVEDYARQGWRLVQIFAPGTGAYGSAKYFELIFERKVD